MVIRQTRSLHNLLLDEYPMMPAKRSKTEYPMTQNGAFEMLKNVFPDGTLPRSANARKIIFKTLLSKYDDCFQVKGNALWLDEACIADKQEELSRLYLYMFMN